MAKDKAGKVALAKVRDFDLVSIDSRIDTLEGATHSHANKAILDATTESFTTALKNTINNASPSTHDHNTVYYTKSEVDTKVASLVDSSPEALNTLNELAAALGDDPNFATTIATQIGAKENAITAGTASQYFRGDKTWATMPTSLPASDVYAWAKASVKPSYTWSEIGSKPTTFPPDSHTHSYLPLSGGSLAGALDSSSYYKSTIATGTAPYQCTSTTLNTNLNADLLDGYHGSSAATANTYALRDASADIACRLLRPNYANQTTISGALAFRVNNSTDNYVRFCSDTTAIKTWLGALSTGGGTISGDLTITGTLTETSDRRLKTNIQPIRNATDKVQQLQGCTFNKQGFDARLTGVIAQDVQKVLPEAIVTDENGYLSVAYGNLVGLLIESIKELTARVEELESCVAEVTGLPRQ